MIGRERALYLVGQLPRCLAAKDHKTATKPIMYVPTLRRMSADHRLVRIMGWHDAEKLARHFGGEILQPANCADVYKRFRDAEIVRLARAGMKVSELAEIMGIGARNIRAIIALAKQQEEIARPANDNAGSFEPAKTA